MSPAVRARPWIVVGRGAIAHASMAAALAGSLLAQAPAARPAADSRLAAASRALAAGDLEGALQLGTAYLKQHPRSRRAQLLLVEVHLQRDDLDAAYGVAASAVRADPRDVDALYHLGLVTRRLAALELARLVESAPGSARARQLQAEALEAQDRRADAEKEYAAALEAQPDLLDALLGLGRLKRIRLACEEAIALYDRAEAIRPTFDAAYGLGVCHGYLQNDAVAAARFEEAIARDRTAAVAWAGLGTSLVKLRRTAEGIEKLQRAIAIEPEMAEAHYMLGMAYQAAGDRERAAEAFRKAEALRGR
jgi:tetratricopeptide (TPR) repeat protein